MENEKRKTNKKKKQQEETETASECAASVQKKTEVVERARDREKELTKCKMIR